MEYVLTRSGPADDPRIARIHTPEEVIEPTWDDGTWTARCHTRSASRTLQGRRYGFELLGEIAGPDEYAPVTVPMDEMIEALGFRIRYGEPDLDRPNDGPEADWRAWQDRGRPAIRPIDSDGIHQRLREHVAPGDMARAGQRSFWAGEEVAIVEVCHGWGERERGAVSAALGAAADLGDRSRVCVVQNDETVQDAFRDWCPEVNARAYHSQATRNDGFGAACRAGANLAPDARWYLFTQPDATWDAQAVRMAIQASLALALPPAGFGAPAIIGPSGGYLQDLKRGNCFEYGRNVEAQRGLPMAPVDWIAGYWLLVHGDTYRKVGGWSDRYFLYYEDPDFSLRCAMAGARPFAWPALPVEHVRGGTIRSRLQDAVVDEIRRESRATFVSRWGGR